MAKQEAENKILVLIRHAHRDTEIGREADNGLSGKGKKQAALLAKYFKIRFDNEKAAVYSSPKRRCIETIEEVAEKAKTKPTILACLDESDSHAELARRIKEFMRILETTHSKVTIASSHGDWIPEFMDRVLGLQIALEKGAWAEIEFEPEGPRLVELIQDFSFLKK